MRVNFQDFGIFDREQYCQGPKSKLLENSRPTACYFQWNSWKLWGLIFRYWCIFMLVSKLCDFWPQAVSSRFSNNQNHYFIDFWLGSWSLRGRKNVSVGHETSIPSIEKVSAVSFSSRGLFFSSIWTVRPRYARGKENSSLGKGSWALTFSSRGYTCFRPYRTFISYVDAKRSLTLVIFS